MLEESHLQIAERGESNIFVWRVQRDSETFLTGLSLSLSLRALMLLSPYVKTITTTTNNTQHTPKIILNWQVLETLLHIFWHSDKMSFLQENLSWVRRQDQVLHCNAPMACSGFSLLYSYSICSFEMVRVIDIWLLYQNVSSKRAGTTSAWLTAVLPEAW